MNVGSEENFVLLVAYLIGALRPSGPFPVLGILELMIGQ
jgi:hypothetical protein